METIPFGKYEGEPVEVLRQDPFYRRWLLDQDWFEEKFYDLYTAAMEIEEESP